MKCYAMGHFAFPWMIMMTGCFLGMTAQVVAFKTMQDDKPKTITDVQGAFTAMATTFTNLGGFYKICSAVLMVSATASFMSTADSVIISLSNQWTEDHFVGWLQNYVPAHALGGRSKQALVAGKIVSVLVMLTSVCIALYADISWLQLLQIGMMVVWAFLVPACEYSPHVSPQTCFT